MEGTGYTPLLQENYPPQDEQTADQQYPPPKFYPPQQGYPPQEGNTYVPPPYYPPPQQQPYPPDNNTVPITQQHTTNVVVIQSQPNPVVRKPVVRHTGDHYLTLSVALTCCCLFIGTWYSLFCTVPAIFFALSARDAERQGDFNRAQSKGRVALILNIVSIVWWMIAIVIIVISASVAVATANNGYYCYYYTDYSSDYDYDYTNYYSYTGYTCYK